MDFKAEEDFHCARVMSSGAQALEYASEGGNFYLHIEAFDPHEPWFVPEPYRSMYGSYLGDEVTCWPPYPWVDNAETFFEKSNKADLQFIRQQYAGNITMVDNHLGKILATLDKKNLWDSTVVILTADHGHDLGERDIYGKNYPHWNTHAHIPLIICHPDYSDHRRETAFTTTVDLHDTVMDIQGMHGFQSPNGRSLMPLITGKKDQVRDGVLYGDYGTGVCWVDEEYTFFSGYDNSKQSPIWYSTIMPRGCKVQDIECGRFIPGVDFTVMRMPFTPPRIQCGKMFPQVYLRNDLTQQNDLSGDEKLLEECRRRLRAALEEEHSPPEQYRRLLLER